MTNYHKLVKERALAHIDALHMLECKGHLGNKWSWWSRAVEATDIHIDTLEEICRELACQFLAFSQRRPSHYPILSAFNDRDDAVSEEDAALERIKRGCEE